MNLSLLALTLYASQVPPKGFVPRAVSDEDWNAIAGTKVSEQFEIHRGDSLYKISARLFGDGKYWPKIWAINQGNISNPHLVYPGQILAFESGTLSTLPRMSVMTDATSSVMVEGRSQKGRSAEWKSLPRQRWETVRLKTAAAVDPLGFDKDSRILFRRSDGRRAPFLVSTEEIPAFGTVEGSDRSGGLLSTLDDRIYVQASAALTIGQRFTVSEDPISIPGGYAYRNLSTIKIVQAMGDGLYAAEILENAQGIRQGSLVVTEFSRLKELTPTPAPDEVSAEITMDPLYSSSYVAEHSWVFINKGSAEGIGPGMVFRHYHTEDSGSGLALPELQATRNADFLVLQASEHASLALGIYSKYPVRNESTIKSLRDVSDVLGRGGASRAVDVGGSKPAVRNELDDLDGPAGLSDAEKQELEQLEKHDDQQLPPPDDALLDMTPESAPAPTTDAPLPDELPPAEDLPPAEVAPSAAPPDPFLEE